MKYSDLVGVYSELEYTSKRLEKTFILSNFLKKTNDRDMEQVILLLQGRVFPVHDASKIGVAARLVIRAISIAAGQSVENIEKEWKKTGDLGIVAENLTKKKSQSTLFSASLSVDKVFSNLKKLASMEGSGTVNRKIGLISELLTSAEPVEARYVVRTVLEDLRVGVAKGTLRDSIVWAFLYDIDFDKVSKKINLEERKDYVEVVEAVETAYNMTNDFAKVALAAKKGLDAVKQIDLVVGKPVQVMLAQKEKTIEDAFKRVGRPAALEYKYDGFRMLIHKEKAVKGKPAKISVFTRRLEDVTRQFPEVQAVMDNVKADSFIIDCEGVGFDAKTNRYLPFQSISQRIRRKYDIESVAKRFPVELNVFDVLYVDGRSLINEPFVERRKVLEKMVTPVQRKLVLANQIITDDEKEAIRFFDQAKKKGDEGIMFKNLNSPYVPGGRTGHMVKYKTTMECLDLVVVGAEWGEGKRKGWLTSFVLACKSEDGFLEIGRVGTGIKELEGQGISFNELTELLKPHIVSAKGRDVRIKPVIVLEIAYEEIQKSPKYSSGFALRFPRVVRDRSMERGPEDASDIAYVEILYRQQKK